MLEPFPDRGLMRNVEPGNAVLSAPRTYIATHSTAPPEHQKFEASDSLGVLRCLLQRRQVASEQLKASAKASEQSKKRAGAVAKGPASKKAKRSTDPTAQAPGAPLHPAPESGAGPMYGRVIFTVDILNGKTVVLLQDICRSRGIPTSGRKSEIVQRILTAQQAPYPHGAAGP